MNRTPTSEEAQFKHVFLLDDFSGSGASYIREEGDSVGGKIKRVADNLRDYLSGIVSPTASVTIVLYVATESACDRMRALVPRLPRFENADLAVVQTLPRSFSIDSANDAPFYTVAVKDEYYDHTCYDAHSQVGDTDDVKLGFAGIA